MTVNFTFTDVGADWALVLANRTRHALPRHDDAAAVTILLTTPVLHRVIDGAATLAGAVSSGDASADGDVEAAAQIFGHPTRS